jgi:hypothetical protein
MRARLSIETQPPARRRLRNERLRALVEHVRESAKQKHSVPQSGIAPSQVDRVDREIKATDTAIDELVYEHYGITDEERTIIERT